MVALVKQMEAELALEGVEEGLDKGCQRSDQSRRSGSSTPGHQHCTPSHRTGRHPKWNSENHGSKVPCGCQCTPRRQHVLGTAQVVWAAEVAFLDFPWVPKVDMTEAAEQAAG